MGSPHNNQDSRSMPRPFACSNPECKKKYAMEWAKKNHVKHCVEGK